MACRNISATASAPPINEGIIRKMERDIREAYVLRRRRLFPAYTLKSDGGRWKTVWRRTALFCIERGVKPSTLVASAFEMFCPCPHPNQLLTRRVLDQAVTGHRSRDERHDELRYRCELDEFTVRCSNGDSPEYILSTDFIPLSALFRYVIAKSMGLEKLCDFYRDDAIRQRLCWSKSYVEKFPEEYLPS